jgi:hypothetical protein
MIHILSRNGDYEKALQMTTDIMTTRLEIAGEMSEMILESIYDLCLLHFKMGEYLLAKKRCQDLRDKFKNPEIDQSQQLKKYQLLCLRMQIELDAYELSTAKITME